MAAFTPVTSLFICGAECGLTTVGTLGIGLEHWSAISGTPAIATSGPSYMRSARCFRFNVAGAAASLTHTFAAAIASPATLVARCYVYFATLPNADTGIIYDGAAGGLFFKVSDSTIRTFGSNTGVAGASGIVVTTGRWYCLDLKVFKNATRLIDGKVDGADLAQTSQVASAGTITQVQIGSLGAATADIYIDDLIVSGTSADYPIGPGTTYGLYPKADGAHVYNAAADFGRDGTTLTNLDATSSNETESWNGLTNPLSTTINTSRFISNKAGVSGEYLEWMFDSLPQNVTIVNGLMVVTTNHSASATGNNVSLHLRDRNTSNILVTFGDISEITIVTLVKIFATAPHDSLPFTKAVVDNLRFRWGESSDVNPDPILDGVCFEVDCVTRQMPPDWALISLLFPEVPQSQRKYTLPWGL
jgi:hypothetical protein